MTTQKAKKNSSKAYLTVRYIELTTDEEKELADRLINCGGFLRKVVSKFGESYEITLVNDAYILIDGLEDDYCELSLGWGHSLEEVKQIVNIVCSRDFDIEDIFDGIRDSFYPVDDKSEAAV